MHNVTTAHAKIGSSFRIDFNVRLDATVDDTLEYTVQYYVFDCPKIKTVAQAEAYAIEKLISRFPSLIDELKKKS